MPPWIDALLQGLALPQYGLASLFLIALLSATLLPLGSEPAVLGLLKLNPDLFWSAILVATIGNTIGGMISWWMGRGAKQLVDKARRSPVQLRALSWLQRLGPGACVFSFLPVVGDPLCALAGWLRLPLWPCTGYMAIGKFLRYLVMTALALYHAPQWFGAAHL